MSDFKVNNVSIRINDKHFVKNLSFEVAPGKVFALMGPSGSGKSSLLSYIVGSLSTSFQASGELYIGHRRIDELRIEDRKVGILFQDDLLFPHMSVGENLLFAMKDPSDTKGRINIIESALVKAGLDGFFKRKPSSLSGGQRARVGALRAILSSPQLLLLDEPFSKLDRSLRESFRDFVFSEIKSRAIPCVLVTHDAEDIPPESNKIDLIGFNGSISG